MGERLTATRRTCPDCRGAKIVLKVPSVHRLHPAVAGPDEPGWCRCRRCNCSGHVLINALVDGRLHAETPGRPDHIRL